MVNRIWQHISAKDLFDPSATSAGWARRRAILSFSISWHHVCREWLVGEEASPRDHAFRHLPAQFDYSANNLRSTLTIRLLWRANRQRLDVESMRDTLLAVSGELD